MRLQDLLPGSFSADQFISGPQRLTVKSVAPILFEEEGVATQKGKMTFREVASYWVFGKEAAGELAEQIGSDETDDWIGKVVELRRDRTRFKGRIVDCIRASFVGIAKPAPAIEAGHPEDDDVDALAARLEAARAKHAQKVPA